MKTTVELPDDLLIEAKKAAAERRTTLRNLIEQGLRRELSRGHSDPTSSTPKIRWVTVEGGLAPGLDISSREKMWEWLENDGD